MAVQQFRGSAASGATTEMIVKFTKTFDYIVPKTGGGTVDPGILSMYLDPTANYILPPPGSVPATNYNQFTRPSKLKLWVLPRTTESGIEGSTANRMFMTQFAVPVSLGMEVDDKGLLGQRSTLIKPNFNIQWVKVGDINYHKSFADATVEPFLSQSGGNICLFQLNVIDPDTGDYFKITQDSERFKLQFMMELEFNLPVPPFSVVEGQYGYARNWVDNTLTNVTDPLSGFSQPLRIVNQV